MTDNGNCSVRQEKSGRKTVPRFSVLIPTYNGAHLVGMTIDSVLAQTFGDYEIIVVNDGSTDGTLEVLRSYGRKITIINQDNKGAEASPEEKRLMLPAGITWCFWIMMTCCFRVHSPHITELFKNSARPR